MLHAWLMLVHQLPARPTNARVKTWRRLRDVGALALKNSVYLLPNTPQCREDMEWIRTEVEAMKGQAIVFAVEPVDRRAGDDEIVAAFGAARQADYTEIRRQAESLAAGHKGRRRDGHERAARQLRESWTDVARKDFFGAPGRDQAAAAIERLGAKEEGSPVESVEPRLKPASYRGRLWVTRPRPGIDRMGSAWLIRRFVDPRAKFAFAARPETAPRRAIPFDMFGAGFSHQGAFCSFENLARRFGISDPAVGRLARIVHDLDLKDARYHAAEAPVVGSMVDGLRRVYCHDSDDAELLDQGIRMFEALYRSYAADTEKSPHAGKRPGERAGKRR